MAKEAKAHVKKHLEKTGVDPSQLSDGTIEVLNTFTEAELVKIHELGEQVETRSIKVLGFDFDSVLVDDTPEMGGLPPAEPPDVALAVDPASPPDDVSTSDS
jgi:hypothetical protein